MGGVDEDNEAAKWVSEHTLTDNQLDQIIEHVNTYGNPVLHQDSFFSKSKMA